MKKLQKFEYMKNLPKNGLWQKVLKIRFNYLKIIICFGIKRKFFKFPGFQIVLIFQILNKQKILKLKASGNFLV